MITNVNSSTKYRRRQETKNVLEFIHGRKEGSIYGAWGYISSTADNQTMEKLISGLKRHMSDCQSVEVERVGVTLPAY